MLVLKSALDSRAVNAPTETSEPRGSHARPKSLPVLAAPPGYPNVPHLPPPPPELDVRRRRGAPVPAAVRVTSRAVAEALFSPDGETIDRARLDWLEEDFADFFSRAHGNARMILRASLLALMWLAPLFVFTPLPLTSLSIKRRALALERLEASLLAPAALAVKAMLCILWFEHPTTREETGTEPSCMGGGRS